MSGKLTAVLAAVLVIGSVVYLSIDNDSHRRVSHIMESTQSQSEDMASTTRLLPLSSNTESIAQDSTEVATGNNVLKPVVDANESDELPPLIEEHDLGRTIWRENSPSIIELERAETEREAHLRARREERVAIGNQPIEHQALELATENNVDFDLIKKHASVVATFETPIPLDLYKKQSQDAVKAAFHDKFLLTVYAELDNGYPITMTGKPDFDYIQSMTSMLQQIQTSLGDSWDPSLTQRQWDNEIAAHANMAEFNISERAVVLGLSVPYQEFSLQENKIRQRYKLKAAEVTLGEYDPPIGVNEPVNAAKIAEYRLTHAVTN